MKIVIIGGVAAGTKAAAKAKKLKPESDITIFTSDTHVSYSECGFPYFIEGNFNDVNELFARSVDEFEHSGIKIRLEHECTKILPDEKRVIIKHYDKEFEETYDKLLIATGAYPYIPPIVNADFKNVFTLRRVEDALAIKDIAQRARHATIVGGGYIGIELMEAFVHLGLKTAMIEQNPIILPIFDEDISNEIKLHITSEDWYRTEIITTDFVTEFYGKNFVEGVKTKNGLDFTTDFVIIAAGVRPNVKLAKDAGVELGPTGAIKVTSKMETNLKDIYAAGDCVEKHHIVANVPVWIPLGSTATKEGRCAALNMCGIENDFEGILGSAVTKFFDYTMSMTGLTERESVKLGFDPICATITNYDKVSYMPNARKITIKLVADKNTRKLLGAQSVGLGNADKRINTVTTALMGNVTVDELMHDDITYAPPFSTSIDPLLTVSEQLIKKLNNVK